MQCSNFDSCSSWRPLRILRVLCDLRVDLKLGHYHPRASALATEFHSDDSSLRGPR
jgi:hypothetical protein